MSKSDSLFPALPSHLARRMSSLSAWLAASGVSPDGEDGLLLHALERGIYALECDYWRIRSDHELRADLDWLAQEHVHWLRAFDDVYTDRWRDLLSADPEAALWEAVVRRVLDPHFFDLQPGESAVGGSGLDFKAEAVPGVKVLIDAKCLRIETATKRTGLRDSYTHAGFFSHATVSLARSAKKVLPQLEAGSNHPALVCLGTLHRVAGVHCAEQSAAETLLRYGTSHLFPEPSDQDAPEAPADTEALSGVLLVGASAVSREIGHSEQGAGVRCILNPHATKPLPARALDGIPIGRIRDGMVEWPDGPLDGSNAK